jgi:hypothetical protein
MPETVRTISLRELRQHTLRLHRVVEDAFASTQQPASINFTEMREIANDIIALCRRNP